MGGEVSVRSAPGEGSTFTIEIPAPPANTWGQPVPAFPTTIGRILVAVEDLSVADALARRLAKAGFTLEAAPDAEGGLRFSRPDLPDGLLLDIGPPAHDGEALLSEVQRRTAGRERPCLVVAATALSPEEQSRLAQAGVVLVLDLASQPLVALLSKVEALLAPSAIKARHA